MPKIKVKFTAVMEQVIEWPEDEMHLLNYNNLQCNFDIEKAKQVNEFEEEILDLEKDGEPFEL